MQNFKPVELEDVYRLFNLGATSLVSAADGNDVDVMPATWVCPLNTTPALSTAVIDSVHYTRKLIDNDRLLHVVPAVVGNCPRNALPGFGEQVRRSRQD